MANYKPYDYSQSVLLPVSLEEQLVPGTLEFAIHALVETRMDTSIFDVRYNNALGDLELATTAGYLVFCL